MRRANMMVGAALAAATFACGGGKQDTRSPAERDWEGEAGEEPSDEDEGMIGPERMDEIKALLDRRRTAAARCLTDVIDDGKLKQNARGRVAVSFTITEAGRVTDAKVVEDTLDSPELEACVLAKVQQIEFGELPRPLDWSYTFAFEAM
jgi:TonB family protein